MSSSHGLYEILLLMHAHGKIPNQHRQHKGTHIMVSSWSIIDKAYHTTRSHDPMWYILYASCVDQLESILHSLYWSTLYLLMLYHNILRHIKNSPFDCMLQVLVNQCSTHETLWLRHRAISWILLLKTNSQDLDHPWLIWVPHKNSIFISSSWSYHIHLFKSMILMPILKVYLYLHGIHTWNQHMIFKHYLWNIPSYKTQWKH